MTINAGILENVTDAKLKDRILSIESEIEGCHEVSKKAQDAWDVFQMPYLIKNKNVTDNWKSINGVKLYKTPFKLKREAFVHNQLATSLFGSVFVKRDSDSYKKFVGKIIFYVHVNIF